MMRSILVGILVLMAAGIGWLTFDWYRGHYSGEPFGGSFTLVDQQGAPITEAAFRGQPSAVFFGFTHCPDICPTKLFEISEVLRAAGDGAKAKGLKALFITVDPERDTPDVLKAYTAAFDPSFIGLYGDGQRTAETAKDFKVYYKKVPTGASYTMDHTSLSYVYDAQGKLRLALRHEQPAQDYADAIRKLLNPA